MVKAYSREICAIFKMVDKLSKRKRVFLFMDQRVLKTSKYSHKNLAKQRKKKHNWNEVCNLKTSPILVELYRKETT